jgi:hypothetical protein
MQKGVSVAYAAVFHQLENSTGMPAKELNEAEPQTKTECGSQQRVKTLCPL